MYCPYCRSSNDNGEQRCVRCGRQLQAPASRPAPLHTSTAPALHAVPNPPAEPAVRHAVETPNYQPSLFREPGMAPKVVPIPTLTPLHPVNRESAPRRTPSRHAGPRTPRRSSESQHRLDFQDSPATGRGRSQEAIYCDAPVAQPLHRLLAAFVDGGMVLTGLLMILVPLIVWGEGLVFSRANILLLIGTVAPVAALYRSLWCLADGDTPGMRFAGLRLVDFDGRRPRREQRIVRQIASVLSVISAGVGLAWALVDEESLTWHDHISKTFPTPG
jgi:uncharacterized RDD family membrane protein YckC